LLTLLLSTVAEPASSASRNLESVEIALSRRDDVVLDLADLRSVMRDPPRGLAGLTVARIWPKYPLLDVVDTQYPLYDESVERLRAARARKLRALGVRAAARSDFEPRRGRYFVILEALLLPDAVNAARALAILKDVHVETWDTESPLAPRSLGPRAWGYQSRTEQDKSAAFGFQVENLALKVQISSVGGDFRSATHAIAVELAERARARG
jgi:hypothetical protein